MTDLTFWFSSEQQYKDSRYLETVLKRYDIKYNVKYINSDILIYREINIVMIPITSDIFQFSENELEKYLGVIKWGVDNNTKIVFDYSWELVPSQLGSWLIRNKNEYTESKLYKLLPTFKEKNIKFLSNNSENPEYIFHEDNRLDLLNGIIIDSDAFPYELRSSKASGSDKFHLNTFPVNHEDKKYLFSIFGGDVRRKFASAVLYAGLDYEGLLDDNFWTILQGESWDKTIDEHGNALYLVKDTFGDKYLDHLIKNHDKIIVQKTFDSQFRNCVGNKFEFVNIPSSSEERRIPQEMYDSHFNLVVETITRETFYTEKTYKPIMEGMPFLIFGSPMQNQYLKTRGYEVFPEIFDYSFEEVLTGHRHRNEVIKYTSLFVDEIKRVNKEPRSIFNQKIVKEKVEHNRNLFFKQTTKKSLQEHLIKIFIEEW
jgi:hypothetical protein